MSGRPAAARTRSEPARPAAPRSRNGAAGRAAARRRASVRRRRALAAIVALALGVLVLPSLVAPLFRDAVKEITLPLRHEDIIRQQARDKGLDPSLIAAVIFAESRFEDRTSEAGAKGLMQILPSTAQDIARRSGGTAFELRDLATPQVNIAYGSFYLKYLLRKYDGSEVLALAAYNAGETNVDRWLASVRGKGETFRVADHIPFPETRDYVTRVLAARGDYRRTYRAELGL